VGESAEDLLPADPVPGQHLAQVVLIDDHHPVQEFPAQGADHPFADRVASHRQLHPIRTIL